MTAKLIDISAHNDWPSPLLTNSLDGIILRCAYALGQDRRFAEFVHNAQVLHKPWAAYHFIKPGDGVAQAEAALRILDSVGGCPVLFMDREREGGLLPSEQTADDYIARVKKAGLTTGTYMSLAMYQSHGADIDWPAFWSRIANPILPPIYHAGDFLQYAGDNTPVGNHVDRDIFNGTPDELRHLFAYGRGASQPHTPPITPVPPAALPGQGDAMFNLAPGTSDRSVVIKAGALLYDRAVGGTRYSAVGGEDLPLAFLGGANDKRIVVADGDYGVFVERSDIVATLSVPKRYGK